MITRGDLATPPWVITAGGFHQLGGMDRANYALANYLADTGHNVHVVTHSCDGRLAEKVTVHHRPRPLGSVLLGEQVLERETRATARRLRAEYGSVRVLANGGNCTVADINWVHYVHSAWKPAAGTVSLTKAWKPALERVICRARERRAVASASVVIANSELTRQHTIEHLSVVPERVKTMYLGCDPDWSPPSDSEREEARAWLGLKPGGRVAVFVGALTEDNRKGFDVLFRAWQELEADSAWDVDLMVAGNGRELNYWRTRATALRRNDRTHFLGHISEVKRLLAAADVLVSPVRYEPYGLNVQEAVCRSVPAILSASAGAAEQYGTAQESFLLSDPEDSSLLATKLRMWFADPDGWRERFRSLGSRLRAHTWHRMAREITEHCDRVLSARTPVPEHS